MRANGLFSEHLAGPIAAYCRFVRVSLDTADPKSWARVRGVRPELYPKAIQAVRALIRHGSEHCVVGVNANIGFWNAGAASKLLTLCEDLGVSYLQIRPLLPVGGRAETPNHIDRDLLGRILAEAESLSEKAVGTRVLVSKDKFYRLFARDKGETYTKCRAHYLTTVINARGDVRVCQYHIGDPAYSFGNLHGSSFQQIWQSQRRQDVIAAMNRRSLGTCQVCCKGDALNQILEQAWEVERETASCL